MGLSVQKGPQRGPGDPKAATPTKGCPAIAPISLHTLGVRWGSHSPRASVWGPSRTAPGPILVPVMGRGRRAKPNHLEWSAATPWPGHICEQVSITGREDSDGLRQAVAKRAWVSYRHPGRESAEQGQSSIPPQQAGRGSQRVAGRRRLEQRCVELSL